MMTDFFLKYVIKIYYEFGLITMRIWTWNEIDIQSTLFEKNDEYKKNMKSMYM